MLRRFAGALCLIGAATSVGCAGVQSNAALFSSPSPGAVRPADVAVRAALQPAPEEKAAVKVPPVIEPLPADAARGDVSPTPAEPAPVEKAAASAPVSSPEAAPTLVAAVSAAEGKGLYHIGPEGRVEFPLAFELIDRLLPDTCPDAIQMVRVPVSDRRTEGFAWAAPLEQAIYFMSDDPAFYKTPGLDATLFSLAFKVCLGQVTRQGDRVLSREEKGLRFLEEGFAQYLQTRSEAAPLGGRPEATRNFLDFAARIELAHRFSIDDFWNRLATPAEIAGGQALSPRRLEAQFVAGAFLRDLIEEQGLGIDGYLALWRRLAANPLKVGEDGSAIPKSAVEPVVGAFLADASGGRIPDLQTAWKSFTTRLNNRYFERPTVEMRVEGEQVVVRFNRDMLPERVDLMLDNVQVGAERIEGGLGSWTDPRTLSISLPAVKQQLGLDHVFTVQVNWGRIWQWFRSRDGIPAEGGRIELPEM